MKEKFKKIGVFLEIGISALLLLFVIYIHVASLMGWLGEEYGSFYVYSLSYLVYLLVVNIVYYFTSSRYTVSRLSLLAILILSLIGITTLPHLGNYSSFLENNEPLIIAYFIFPFVVTYIHFYISMKTLFRV